VDEFITLVFPTVEGPSTEILAQRLKQPRRIAARATRFGEFLPNVCLFTLGSGSKITEVAHISGLPFSAVINMY
jgi:hypothetical protein